jgi:tRNA pseudouridine38-40 synthase
MPAEKYMPALNSRLPGDIVVQNSVQVKPDFHPRKVKCKKTYEYTILARKIPLPKYRNTACYYYRPLDLKAMQEAAHFFKGRHDFNAFCSAKTSTQTTIRSIYDIGLNEQKLKEGGRFITLSITGNGFLYNMVRIIAGTLLEVGTGAIAPRSIPEIIMSKDREKAGPTAVPQGLSLKEIVYSKDIYVE